MDSREHLLFAQEQDDHDALRPYRGSYKFPASKLGKPFIYLCGNSLGLQPIKANNDVSQEMDRWGSLGVKGHFEGSPSWSGYSRDMVSQLNGIVGALQGEVTIMNTLTVNIHLMLISFYKPSGKKNKILIEHSPFPSDIYALKSHIRMRGLDPAEILLEMKPREAELDLRPEDIEKFFEVHGHSIALVYIGSVNYLTGQAFDIPALVQLAHHQGALIGFDLAHGAGNVLLALHDWKVDFAVWCHYKYLNGGPNSLAGCFIHQRHHDDLTLLRLEGWWGHDLERRFLMEPDFIPMPGTDAWQLSGPPILSLAGMRAGIEDFDSIGMPTLRQKSLKLTRFLQELLIDIGDSRIQLITPSSLDHQGCQLSILITPPDKRIYYDLIDSGVVVDWREPGIIRVAPVPMYNCFEDVFKFVVTFAKILKNRA